MDRDPYGWSSQAAGHRLGLTSVFYRCSALCILLLALAGCGSKQVPSSLSPLPSPTQIVNSLEELEPALKKAAATFETLDSTEESTAWRGKRYLVNGQEIVALQALSELSTDQVSEAFAGFAAAMNPPVRYWRSDQLGVFYSGSDGGVILLVSGLLGDSQTLETPVMDEPFPPAVLAAIQQLSEQSDLPLVDIQVVDFERVIWPDSCLGLPATNEGCAEAETEGWRIQLKVGQRSWQVHTDEVGQRVRLQQTQNND